MNADVYDILNSYEGFLELPLNLEASVSELFRNGVENVIAIQVRDGRVIRAMTVGGHYFTRTLTPKIDDALTYLLAHTRAYYGTRLPDGRYAAVYRYGDFRE